MKIEKLEKLKSWLTKALDPLCEADPSALARYIVALLQKSKTVDELKDICTEQLIVFLSDKTTEFVSNMFQALESRSYFESSADDEPSLNEPVPMDESDEKIEKEKDYEEPRQRIETRQVRKSKRPCYEYQSKGRCSRGRRCLYNHSPNKNLNKVMIGNLPLIPNSDTIRNLVKDEVFHQMLAQNQIAYHLAIGHESSNNIDHKKRKFKPRHLYSVPKSGQVAKGLVLRNVPQELATVQNVNQHFSKFGKVVNVILCYEKNPSSILVEFSALTEARDAYESAEAIMGNRFIRAFYQRFLPNLQPEEIKSLKNEDLVYVNPEYLEKTKELKKEMEEKEKERDVKKQILIRRIDEEVKKLITFIRDPDVCQPDRESYLLTLKQLCADKDRLMTTGSSAATFKKSYRFTEERPNHLDKRPSAITICLNKFSNPTDLLNHFSKYGKIVFNKIENENLLTIGFVNHFIASKAFEESRICLGERIESIRWGESGSLNGSNSLDNTEVS